MCDSGSESSLVLVFVLRCKTEFSSSLSVSSSCFSLLLFGLFLLVSLDFPLFDFLLFSSFLAAFFSASSFFFSSFIAFSSLSISSVSFPCSIFACLFSSFLDFWSADLISLSSVGELSAMLIGVSMLCVLSCLIGFAP